MSESFDVLEPRIDLGQWIEDAFDWITDTFAPVFDGVDTFLGWSYDTVLSVLNAPPFLIMIAVFAALGWLARSWQFAIFTVLGFYLIAGMDQWEGAMETLSLVLISAVVAVLLAVPLGILAAKSQPVSNAVRPILDFMQTLPPMVYLIPALAAFGIGEVPGMIATVVFAMPPGVRLTELAIRQVDSEVVEAGQAFGSPPGRILRQIQLPLALPTIMAGINQVIMLAFSMVVLAGIVGGPGLGQQVLQAVQRINVGLGVEAGLSVVILAIFLDRVTAALGARSRLTQPEKVA